jgi:hypothetical protein
VFFVTPLRWRPCAGFVIYAARTASHPLRTFHDANHGLACLRRRLICRPGGGRSHACMNLMFLNARDATRVGVALADDFVMHDASASCKAPQHGRGTPAAQVQKLLQRFLQRVDRETRPLQLNLFKRAKLANTFKWRLLEKGIEPQIVDELTQALLLRMTAARADPSRARSTRN